MRNLCLAVILGLWLAGCQARESQPLWSFKPEEEIAQARFSPDGSTLAVAGSGGKVWLLDGSGSARALPPGPDEPSFLQFSTDGQWLASASHTRRKVTWWSVAEGKLLTSIDAGKAEQAAQQISHEAILWVDGNTGMVSNKSVAYIGGEEGTTVAGLAFSKDALLSTDTRGTVEFWDREGEMTRLFGVGGIVALAQLSPSGDRLAVSGGNRLRVFELADGKKAIDLSGNSDYRPLEFSPTGEYLATTSLGESKLLWLSNKSVAIRFPEVVRAFDFSADGRYLACAGSDKTAVWNVSTRAPEGELKLRAEDISALENGQGVLARQESAVLLWLLKKSEPSWRLEKSTRSWAVSGTGLVALVTTQGEVECWKPPLE